MYAYVFGIAVVFGPLAAPAFVACLVSVSSAVGRLRYRPQDADGVVRAVEHALVALTLPGFAFHTGAAVWDGAAAGYGLVAFEVLFALFFWRTGVRRLTRDGPQDAALARHARRFFAALNAGVVLPILLFVPGCLFAAVSSVEGALDLWFETCFRLVTSAWMLTALALPLFLFPRWRKPGQAVHSERAAESDDLLRDRSCSRVPRRWSSMPDRKVRVGLPFPPSTGG